MDRVVGEEKIIFLVDHLMGGGAERVLYTLYSKLRNDLELNCKLVTISDKCQYESYNREKRKVLVSDYTGIKSYVLSFMRFYKYLREEKPTTVFSTLVSSNILNVVITKLFFRKSIKVVIREANTLSVRSNALGWKYKVQAFLCKIFYPMADVIVAPSHGVKSDLLEYIPRLQNKVRVISNPLDIGELEMLARKFQPVESNFIIAVGRLHEQKAFDILIKSYAVLYRSNKSVPKLLILGEGPEKKYLKTLVDSLELGEMVIFKGFVENPYPYIMNARLLVMSSRWEGLPNVLIQALGLGTNIVSTDCRSGPAEILLNGKYGILVEVDNVEELALSIHKSLFGESRFAASVLQDLAFQRFEVSKIAKAYKEVLC